MENQKFIYFRRFKTKIPKGAFVDGWQGSGRVVNGKVVITRPASEGLKDTFNLMSKKGKNLIITPKKQNTK